ncbi:MAG: hypothetical protein R2734_13485 [Nocardioides sp.]
MSTRCGPWATVPGRLAELWTFFPDPWHKKRHHKRRLVTPAFAIAGARRLAVAAGGGWPPTGRTTPSRWARCSTPSRCSPAESSSGGPSVR